MIRIESPVIESRVARRTALAGIAASLAAPALAQGARPVTIVVAYPAGGDTDVMARMYAERLAPRLGRPVVVENRPGASGAIGSAYVARAAADGRRCSSRPTPSPSRRTCCGGGRTTIRWPTSRRWR